MDSLQVRVAVPRSPADYSSPPSFGLSDSDSEDLDTPLHRRVTRMTCRGPWSPRATGSSASPATRGSALRSPTVDSQVSGRVEVDAITSARSPDSGRKTESILSRSQLRDARQDPELSVRRNIGRSFERSTEQSIERSQDRSQERSRERSQERRRERSQERSQERSRERSQERSQERSPERSGAAEEEGGEPKTSTPRHGSEPSPFTPRAFDKLLHDERQRHLEEAKVRL